MSTHDAEKRGKTEERFIVSESLLTTAIREDPLARSLYSAGVAFAILRLASVSFKYAFLPGLLASDWRLLERQFTGFRFVLWMEAAVHASLVLLAAPVTRLRQRKQVCLRSYCACMALVSLVLLLLPPYLRFAHSTSETIAIMLSMEQVRLLMKLISFVVESERSLRREDSKEEPSWGSMLYFLFAPVLVYRHSYPRSPTRSWCKALFWFAQYLYGFWSVLVVVNHGFTDAFSFIGKREATVTDWVSMFHQSCIMGIMEFLAIAFFFLDVWLNAWGEVLSFGDRRFYKNYLTSADVREYLNRWNTVTRSWITEYLFKPTIVSSGSHVAATLVSIMMSCILHDYVFTFSFGFLSTTFLLNAFIGFFTTPLVVVVCSLCTRCLGDASDSPTNVSMWISCSLTILFHVMVTGIRYHHAINCPSAALALLPSLQVCT